MRIELWKEIFDWAAVFLVGFTFISGAGALITGKILDDRKSEQLRRNEQRLEAEKRKRIELAVSLLPRRFRDQSGAIEKLRNFPPATALIEYIDDKECLETAEQINAVLVGWRTSGVPVKTMWPDEGIGISTGRVRTPDESLAALQATEAAGQTLVAELNRSGIKATWMVGSRSHQLPFETLYISVGVRPNAALDNALKELGPEEPPTPLGENGLMMSGSRKKFSTGP